MQFNLLGILIILCTVSIGNHEIYGHNYMKFNLISKIVNTTIVQKLIRISPH